MRRQLLDAADRTTGLDLAAELAQRPGECVRNPL